MDNDIRFRDIQYNENKFTLELDNSEDTTAATSALASISNSIQINGKQLVWSEQAAEKDALLSYAVEQTIDSLEKRVNELGISEVQIARQGQHHIGIDMPGVQDIAYAKKNHWKNGNT